MPARKAITEEDTEDLVGGDALGRLSGGPELSMVRVRSPTPKRGLKPKDKPTTSSENIPSS